MNERKSRDEDRTTVWYKCRSVQRRTQVDTRDMTIAHLRSVAAACSNISPKSSVGKRLKTNGAVVVVVEVVDMTEIMVCLVLTGVIYMWFAS